MAEFTFRLPPTDEGYLPLWLGFVFATTMFNFVQNHLTLDLNKRIYRNRPAQVTGLQARTFAIWGLVNGLVRLYCAYNIHDEKLYQLSMATFAIGLWHFFSEFLVFGTAGLGPGLLSPLIVAGSSLVWMVRDYDFYVKR